MVDGLVRCVHPGIDNHVSFGTVLNVGYDAGLMQSFMDVEDLEGRVLIALTEYGCDLTVLGNYGEVYPKGLPRRSNASPHPRSLRELFDGRASRIAGVISAPGSDITRIDLLPGVFFPAEAVYGAILRASDDETAATAPVIVVDPFGTYIEIFDPADEVFSILDAGGQFVIFDQHIGSYSGKG